MTATWGLKRMANFSRYAGLFSCQPPAQVRTDGLLSRSRGNLRPYISREKSEGPGKNLLAAKLQCTSGWGVEWGGGKNLLAEKLQCTSGCTSGCGLVGVLVGGFLAMFSERNSRFVPV